MSDKKILKQLQEERRLTKDKYNGKTIYDKKAKETFVFNFSRDWQVLNGAPDRFEVK